MSYTSTSASRRLRAHSPDIGVAITRRVDNARRVDRFFVWMTSRLMKPCALLVGVCTLYELVRWEYINA